MDKYFSQIILNTPRKFLNNYLKHERDKLLRRLYKSNNKEKNKKDRSLYYQKNKEKIDKYNSNYIKTHPEIGKKKYQRWIDKDPENARKCRIKARWKGFGLNLDNFEEVWERYNNTTLCDYCAITLTIDKRNTPTTKCMDHCHTTGKFRAILCNFCNLHRVTDI